MSGTTQDGRAVHGLDVLTDEQVRAMFPGATEAGFEAPAMRALLGVLDIIAEAIRDMGDRGIPSGHLYAVLSGTLNLDTYLGCIKCLKAGGLIEEKGHRLTWVAR